MCSHGDSPPELLVSSKLRTYPLDTVDAGDIDAPRHERLGKELRLWLGYRH